MPANNAVFPRVVHVTTSHLADDVRIFERECRSLADSGKYSVFLVAAGAIPNESGVMLHPLPRRPTSRAFRFVRGPWDAWRFARNHHFDVWHFHDPELLPLAIRLAKRGKTVVWDAHEDYESQFTGDGAKSWVPTPLRGSAKAGVRALLSRADGAVTAVVAATPTIASRYRNRTTVVVGNEARTSDFKNCTPSFAARQLLFTGTPTEGHCFPQLVEAIAGLADVRLLVAGRNPQPEVWAYAKRRLGDRLRHAGWLDREGIAQAISRSSIGLVLYSNSVAHASNAGNKLFEFAAAGLPIVATPTPSNTSYITSSKAGLVTSGFAADAIREAVSTALSDEASWETWASAGPLWASENGSWASSEARLLSLYAELTSGR